MAGVPGTPGLAGVEIVSVQGNVITSGLATSSATAPCPGTKKAIGGGHGIDNIGGGTFSALLTFTSAPVVNNTGWSVSVTGQSSDDWAVRAYAVCATVAP